MIKDIEKMIHNGKMIALEKKLKFDINDNNFMEKIYRDDAINSTSKKKKQFYHEIANEYQLKSTIAKEYLGLIKC